MASVRVESVGELLYWSYANLAAAEMASKRQLPKPDHLCYMVRAKLFKGLRTGTMSVGSLFEDARLMPPDACVYCRAVPPPKLHADHLIPKHRGGPESADNLVWACRSCNSSKGAKDLLEWYAERSGFPPLPLMRRYLKLAMAEANKLGVMATKIEERPPVCFSLASIPTRYPTSAESATG